MHDRAEALQKLLEEGKTFHDLSPNVEIDALGLRGAVYSLDDYQTKRVDTYDHCPSIFTLLDIVSVPRSGTISTKIIELTRDDKLSEANDDSDPEEDEEDLNLLPEIKEFTEYEKVDKDIPITAGHEIKKLRIRGLDAAPSEMFRVLSNTPNVESLDIDFISTVPSKRKQEHAEQYQRDEYYLPLFPKLKELFFLMPHYAQDEVYLTQLLQMCPNLEKLSFTFFHGPGNALLKFIVKHNPKLKKLKYKPCDPTHQTGTRFTDDALLSFASSLPLEQLSMDGDIRTNGRQITEIAGKAKQLRSLKYCRSEYNEMLSEIYINAPLPNLEKFSLQGTNFDSQDVQDLAESLIKYAPNIKTLLLNLDAFSFPLENMVKLVERLDLENIYLNAADYSFTRRNDTQESIQERKNQLETKRHALALALSKKKNLRKLECSDHPDEILLFTKEELALCHFPKCEVYIGQILYDNEWLAAFHNAFPNLIRAHFHRYTERVEIDYSELLRMNQMFGLQFGAQGVVTHNDQVLPPALEQTTSLAMSMFANSAPRQETVDGSFLKDPEHWPFMTQLYAHDCDFGSSRPLCQVNVSRPFLNERMNYKYDIERWNIDWMVEDFYDRRKEGTLNMLHSHRR
jgi:hypothetical protein